MAVVIRKSGFYARDWSTKVRRDVEKRIKDPMVVVGRMNDRVELHDDVTLGHLVNLFRGDYDPIKEIVAMLVDCNLDKFWNSIDDTLKEEGDDSELYAIEIYCSAEISNQDAKAKLPRFDFSYGCHGLGAKWPQGKGNSYALEFTPWAALKDLKLSIASEMRFNETVWKKGRRHKIVSNGPNSGWNISDRQLVRSVNRTLQAPAPTLLEFLQALFNELAFFGSPANAKAQHKEILARANEVRRKKRA